MVLFLMLISPYFHENLTDSAALHDIEVGSSWSRYEKPALTITLND